MSFNPIQFYKDNNIVFSKLVPLDKADGSVMFVNIDNILSVEKHDGHDAAYIVVGIANGAPAGVVTKMAYKDFLAVLQTKAEELAKLQTLSKSK